MVTDRIPLFLLVEDSPTDVKILQRALAQTPHPVELLVLRDGQEAVDYLLRQGPFSPGSTTLWRRPDLIVLDLNLPRMTGLEVLGLIRSSVPFRLTPVVVMSMSRHPEDVKQAYAGGANIYIEKPLDFGRFVAILKTLQEMWLEMAVLAPAPPI